MTARDGSGVGRANGRWPYEWRVQQLRAASTPIVTSGSRNRLATGVSRGPVRGPSHRCKQCNQGHRWHDPVVSVQLVRTMHGAVLLIIRRSWVRAPPAPPDPLTGRENRFCKTCKTERAAQIELGKLLAMAQGEPAADGPGTRLEIIRPRPGHDSSCPAAARTSVSPWPRAPPVAFTASCPGPSRQRYGGSGPTGTRPGRPSLPPPAVRP